MKTSVLAAIILSGCASQNPLTQSNFLVGTGGTNTQTNYINNFAIQKRDNATLTALKADIQLQGDRLRNLGQFLENELVTLKHGKHIEYFPAPFDLSIYHEARTGGIDELGNLPKETLNSVATFYNLLSQINEELGYRKSVTPLPLSNQADVLRNADSIALNLSKDAISRLTSEKALDF